LSLYLNQNLSGRILNPSAYGQIAFAFCERNLSGSFL